jgi:hypothetical protein
MTKDYMAATHERLGMTLPFFAPDLKVHIIDTVPLAKPIRNHRELLIYSVCHKFLPVGGS